MSFDFAEEIDRKFREGIPYDYETALYILTNLGFTSDCKLKARNDLVKEIEKEMKGLRNMIDIKNAEIGMLNTMMDHAYINKNKIKEKIEEISGMNNIADIEREIYNRNEYAIEILLELLEE